MLEAVKKNQGHDKILNYFHKFKGHRREYPVLTPAPIDIIVTIFGVFIGISLLSILTFVYHAPMLAAPFGASAVLIYGIPDAPLSQPRNVILGHTISAAIGVSTVQFCGMSWWSIALGVCSALLAMLLTKTTHPPGGATALFAIISGAGPQFIFVPMFCGSLILVLIAVVVNNLSPNRSYPRYWF